MKGDERMKRPTLPEIAIAVKSAGGEEKDVEDSDE